MNIIVHIRYLVVFEILHFVDISNKILEIYFVRCCIYLTTYDWIQSFLNIVIEDRAIYGNLENKINAPNEQSEMDNPEKLVT